MAKSKRQRQIENNLRRRRRLKIFATLAAFMVWAGIYFHYELAIKCAEAMSAWYGLFELLMEI